MKCVVPALLLSVVTWSAVAEEVPAWEEGFRNPPAVFPAPEVTEEGVTAVYLEGPSYAGKPTKFFAFYGLPEKTRGRKVPGIVLVHGAGGTAFAEWVRLWTSRGYAAIAIDHSGHVPIFKDKAWQKNPEAGPPLNQPDAGQAKEEQWMYHAVADSMLAVSFLQSLPEVDPERIGVTGISWGGVVAAVQAGVDDRLKFVVPVYGCGYISEESTDGSLMLKHLAPDALVRWRAKWDPANYLAKAKMPMLWVTGSNDAFFTLQSIQRSSQTATGPQALSIRLRMIHGHGGHGEKPEEIRAFADSIVNSGKPLPAITKQGHDAKQAWVSYDSKTRISKAELEYTTDQGNWQDRNWQTAPAKVDTTSKKVTAEIPAGTTNYYFNLIDDRDLIVSSPHVVLIPPPASQAN